MAVGELNLRTLYHRAHVRIISVKQKIKLASFRKVIVLVVIILDARTKQPNRMTQRVNNKKMSMSKVHVNANKRHVDI